MLWMILCRYDCDDSDRMLLSTANILFCIYTIVMEAFDVYNHDNGDTEDIFLFLFLSLKLFP